MRTLKEVLPNHKESLLVTSTLLDSTSSWTGSFTSYSSISQVFVSSTSWSPSSPSRTILSWILQLSNRCREESSWMSNTFLRPIWSFRMLTQFTRLCSPLELLMKMEVVTMITVPPRESRDSYIVLRLTSKRRWLIWTKKWLARLTPDSMRSRSSWRPSSTRLLQMLLNKS